MEWYVKHSSKTGPMQNDEIIGFDETISPFVYLESPETKDITN